MGGDFGTEKWRLLAGYFRLFNPGADQLNKQAVRDVLSGKGNLLNIVLFLFQFNYFAGSYELFRNKEDSAGPAAVPGMGGYSADQLYLDDLVGRGCAFGAVCVE